MKTGIDRRAGHLYTTVSRRDALSDISEDTTEEKKRLRKQKQATFRRSCSLFDINKCGLECLRNETTRENYAQLLVEIMVAELSDILRNDLETNGDYKNDFMTVYRRMLEHLDMNSRKNPNAALEWWKAVENPSVIELRR